MFYVYFLQGKDGNLYIGRTNNIGRRLAEHTYGMVSSTKSRRPLKLLGFEPCQNEAESVSLEKEFKKGYKREELKKRFKLR